MSLLSWDAFYTLPGSAEANFEMLCRAAIRRNYAQYGIFAARAAQPGVEFHLKLDRDCSLGNSGRWWGWQCRWYDLPSGRAIGNTRRSKIKKALETTQRELPDLTDWVLWTRRPLTAADQKWFYGLSNTLKLHLWTAAEVEEHLSGEAVILRATFFGDLVLTPQLLHARHVESTAPVKKRWTPEVHQSVRAERQIRGILGEAGSWQDLTQTAAKVRQTLNALDRQKSLPVDFIGAVDRLKDGAERMARFLDTVTEAVATGDLDRLHHALSQPPPPLERNDLTLPRRLRATRHLSGLLATNLVADLRRAQRLPRRVQEAFGVRLVAVVADAGNGKTQMAAQLTASSHVRPAGVLLYGRDLHAAHSLDDLARRVVIGGKSVPTFEALLEAVDAAGQRARRRLPIVIDGLNEAEDPRRWKFLLAALTQMLTRYAYTLVICTVRGAFADEALPDDATRLEVKGFDEDVGAAISRYFQYYRIDATDADVPFDMLRHPLKLRLYCEVTNPTRAKDVSIEAAPSSLTGLFDLYIQQASERIADLSPLARRYYQRDVRIALDEIGAQLWERRARAIEISLLSRLLSEEQRPWDQTLVRALEHEGILLRLPRDGGSYDMVPVFDALGGHLIADAVLARHGQAGMGPWLLDAATREALAGDYEARHPLASDIFVALVGLFPRRLHRLQVWQLLQEPLRSQALRLTADLEAAFLDGATINELIPLIEHAAVDLPDVFDRLRQTRGSLPHPLNANFLDRVLRLWTVADRDLRWTEWLRRRHGSGDVRWLTSRWKNRGYRPADTLWATWLMWTLTTTVRDLRDEVTRALYWFGRLNPKELFDLTLSSLTINDAYVPERMLASAYGVVMAQQEVTSEFRAVFGPYLAGLAAALCSDRDVALASHWLVRTYVRGTFEFARRHYPELIPESMSLRFSSAPEAEPVNAGDERSTDVSRTLRMDFINYTIGGLFEARSNYDMEHLGHRAATAYVRGVVWTLGWRNHLFGSIDEQIASDSWARQARPFAERYGKKYGWIGFYTYAGVMEDQSKALIDRERLPEVDIDPSFPDPPPSDVTLGLDWLSPDVASDKKWIASADATVLPDTFFYRDEIGAHAGPWVVIHANLQSTDKVIGRTAFGLLSAVAVDRKNVQTLLAVLANVGRPGGRLFDVPSDHYTFAGEIPWSDAFAREGRGSGSEPLYRIRVSSADVKPFMVETFAHRYAWESYHSTTNDAGGGVVPSKAFSTRRLLRAMPQSFDQADSLGRKASISLNGPAGMSGELLFVREDLLLRYLRGRTLVWIGYGERRLYGASDPPPKWYSNAFRDGKNSWKVVADAADRVSSLGRVARVPPRDRTTGKSRTLQSK